MAEDALRIGDEFGAVSIEEWKARLEKDLKGKPPSALHSRVEGSIEVRPLYTREDAVDPVEIGLPGFSPHVRGSRPLGSRWVVRQEYDDPRMEVCAESIRRDLERGVEGVWLRCGTEHGTRIHTPGDLHTVLEAVDLAQTSICLEPESDVLPTTAALVAVARHRGVALGDLHGLLGADPFGALLRKGTLVGGLKSSKREAMDVALWASRELPSMRTMLVSSRPYADAGVFAVEELGWAIATGTEYLRLLTDAGLEIDEAVANIGFALSVGGDIFVQIAKLRAARLLWSKVVKAAGGANADGAMWIHARTASSTKAQRDPWVNMLRGTAESFAAIVGGADSIATAPFDEALGPSNAFARRIARNTQLILREESHLAEVIDPAGGSWYVEQLTDSLARAAWEVFRSVERLGGIEKAIVSGRIARGVEEAQRQQAEALRAREERVVGVSEFPKLDEEPVARPKVDMQEVEVELGAPLGDPADQSARLEKLEELAEAAQSDEVTPSRLTELAVESAALGVDLYVMGVVLRDGKPSVHVEPLPPFRRAKLFEALRDRSDAFLAETGKRPAAFLACLGTIAEHNARATWITNVLAAGGIDVVPAHGFEGDDVTEAVVERYQKSGANAAILCGPDALYEAHAPGLARALTSAGADVVGLAGKGGEREDALREAGVHVFFHVGADLIEGLSQVQKRLGVMG